MLARNKTRTTGKGASIVVAFVAITAIVALVVLMFNFLNNQETSTPSTIKVEAPRIEVPAPSAPSMPNPEPSK